MSPQILHLRRFAILWSSVLYWFAKNYWFPAFVAIQIKSVLNFFPVRFAFDLHFSDHRVLVSEDLDADTESEQQRRRQGIQNNYCYYDGFRAVASLLEDDLPDVLIGYAVVRKTEVLLEVG